MINDEVINGFFKIADDMDLLGKRKEAKDDIKDIKEKHLPTPEKDIVEEAHPEPVYVAEALGNGALVENQNEQHKKFIEIMNKMPTGLLINRYAQILLDLKKIADVCDDIGETEASNLVVEAAEKILFNLPLDKAPVKAG